MHDRSVDQFVLNPAARGPGPQAAGTHWHECARDPPVGCASAAAGLLSRLCVRSDETASHVAPPAPPLGVAPAGPG